MELSETQPHPNPHPNPLHRKVDLQTLADLTYLQRNLAQSARQKLDLHFPPVVSNATLGFSRATPATVISLGGAKESTNAPSTNVLQTGEDAMMGEEQTKDNKEEEEDPLRARVRLLVDSFLKQTWQSAHQNVTVNGIDASALSQLSLPTCTNPSPSTDKETREEQIDPSTEIEGVHFTYEAFDSRLQHKLASLHGELETLTAQVSQLRREAPKKGAETYQNDLQAAMAADEEEALNSQAAQLSNVTGLKIQSVRLGWNEDVKEVYERGLQELANLNGLAREQDSAVRPGGTSQSLTETVGKAQRARNVAMEFE